MGYSEDVTKTKSLAPTEAKGNDMNAAYKMIKEAVATQPKAKKIKGRNNDPVFTSVKVGVYNAQLLGYRVTLIRAEHNEWHCIDSHSREMLGIGTTRNEATEDAYNRLLNAEAKRLDWVLADQPYRVYGSRGKYNGNDEQEDDCEQSSNVVQMPSKEAVEDEANWNVIYSDTLQCYFYTEPEDSALKYLRGPFFSQELMEAAMIEEEYED